MTQTPYISRLTLANAAHEAGHVVATTRDSLQITSPDLTITIDADHKITDNTGATYRMDQAARALKLSI